MGISSQQSIPSPTLGRSAAYRSSSVRRVASHSDSASLWVRIRIREMEKGKARCLTCGETTNSLSQGQPILLDKGRSLLALGGLTALAGVSRLGDLPSLPRHPQQFCTSRNRNGVGRVRCDRSYIQSQRPSEIIMQVPKKHFTIVGLLGLVVVAAAGGGVYYYQFVLPHTAVTYTPSNRLGFMTATVQEEGGVPI